MSEPIFTPEAPPAVPPKKKMSNGMKIALGCGLFVLLGLGTCAGGLAYCGHKVTSLGQDQWTDLRTVANDLATDAGAAAQYQRHPGLAQAYPTEQDFVGAARLWRPNLEPLPADMPPLLSGKISLQTNSTNGVSKTLMAYSLASGKRLVGTWKNDQLVDLQLE